MGRRTRVAARKALAVFVSVVLVVGLMPGFAAWGDLVDQPVVPDTPDAPALDSEETLTSDEIEADDEIVYQVSKPNEQAPNVDVRIQSNDGGAPMVIASDTYRISFTYYSDDNIVASENTLGSNPLNPGDMLHVEYSYQGSSGRFENSGIFSVDGEGYLYNNGTVEMGSGFNITWTVPPGSGPWYFVRLGRQAVYLSKTEPSATLTLNLNGGVGDDVTKTGKNIAIDTTATRSGYTFSGWNTAANGLGDHYDSDGSIAITENTTLYAEWTRTATLNAGSHADASPASVVFYYDADGKAYYNKSTSEQTAPVSVTLTPATGWTAVGWTTSTTATVADALTSDGVAPSDLNKAETTFYAITSRPVSLTYADGDADSGTSEVPDGYSGTQIANAGGTVTQPSTTLAAKPDNLAKKGCVFGGWDINGTTYQPDATFQWSSAADAHEATTAGSYAPVVASLADATSGADKAKNYKLPANTTGAWNINPPGTNSMTVSIAGWTYGQYNATANKPSVTADFGASTATYTYWADAACTQPADGSDAGNVPANAGNYWVKADIAATANYPAASATCAFAVAKAKITVTADDKQSVRAESGAIAALTYTVAPSLVGSDSLDDVVEAASDTAPNQINPAKTGSYVIKAGYKFGKGAADVPNYDITFVDGTYTVTRALANVTATGYAGTYDGVADAEKITVTVADAASGAQFGGSGTGLIAVYYAEADFQTSLGLTSAQVTALQGADVTTDDFKGAWNALQTALAGESTTSPAYKDAGTHTVYFMVVSDQVTPDVIFGSKDVVISKAPLTVTANNKEIAYGDAADNDGVTYGGFVNGETEGVLSGTPAYDYGTYVVGSPVGNYPITPSGLTAANYDITYVPGTLTVSQAELSLAWPSPDFLVYSGAAQSYGPPTLGGAVSGDDVKVELNAGTGTATDAGDYTATVARLTGAAASNYTLAAGAQLSHDWHITPATLVVKAKDKTIVYGDEPSDAGAEFTTLLGNDTEASLEGALAFSFDYVRYGDVGTYKITPSGLTSPNYSIAFQDGALTVEPRELALTWPEPDEFDYTGSELTYGPPTLSGAVNGDDVSIGIYSGDAATDVGTHTAMVESLSGNDAGNYKLPDDASHDWTIVGADNAATVTIEGWTYGDAANEPVVTATFGAYTATFAYFADEDCTQPVAADALDANGAPKYAGDYWVRATIPAAGSYAGAEATAPFTIVKRPATVTAKMQVVEVGASIATGADQAELSGAAAGDALSAVALTGSSTAAATEEGTITPSDAKIADAAGADTTANYEITYVPAKLIVAPAVTTANGKVIYALHQDIWLSVAEAEVLCAADDRDEQIIDLSDVHALLLATGEELGVIVKEDGGLVPVVGDYELTLKANPELGVTAHVYDSKATDPDTGITVFANDTTPDVDVLRKAKDGGADAIAALIELAKAAAVDADGNPVDVTDVDLSAVDPDNPTTYKVTYSTANGASATANLTVKESETPGDDTPGDDTPGGDTPGGDVPGGDTPGGDTPGGDTPGGDTPGSDTPGGDTPGGDTPGDDTSGDDTPGGDTPGGDTPDEGKPGSDTSGAGAGSGADADGIAASSGEASKSTSVVKTGDTLLTHATGALLITTVLAIAVLVLARRRNAACYHGAHVRK